MALILVSNRLPVTVKRNRDRISVQRSAGGLATGLSGPHLKSGGVWIGWPGDTGKLTPEQLADLDRRLAELHTAPVHLSAAEMARYYEGFSNSILWPLFHGFLDRLPRQTRDFEAYAAVNRRFADAVVERYRPGDLIWVHDYQLMLLPAMLRKRLPDARIGFFLHIPFPSAEIFRTLPWREAILDGILGADLVGFHTLSYVREFAGAVLSLMGIASAADRIVHRGREVRLGCFPMGIDAPAFAAQAEMATAEAADIRDNARGQKLLLGIDRLDYTKGIPRRLLAIERLLERERSLRGQIRLIQLAIPSREKVDQYVQYRHDVDQLVGRINGAYGTATEVPIHYLFRSVPPRQLAALYRAADVMLVTPLRDGMNLVCKEFVASRIDDDGVLVLSEFAGAASELGEAVQVNPYDIDGMATAIKRSLEMPRDERQTRMRALRKRVFEYDVHRWADSFVAELDREPVRVAGLMPTTERDLAAVLGRVRAAERVALMLDYDGTLTPIVARPELARPTRELARLLEALAARDGTQVHVVSGRPRQSLEDWLGRLPLSLHAEHGAWSRPPGEEWRLNVDVNTDWMETVREVMAEMTRRTPGSFIEEKTVTLAWHYRMSDPELAGRQATELRAHLDALLNHAPLEVVCGDKVIEVRPYGVHKGLIPPRVLTEYPGALMLAIGDDRTDEDLFSSLPEGGISIHVGRGFSLARYRVSDVSAVTAFLRALVENGEAHALPR